MRVEKRNGYRVVVGGPVPPQAEAITLERTIFVRKRSCADHELMAHELVHVRQFKEFGPIRFVARYVGSYVRFRLGGYGHMAAYRRIPLEVEASWVSRLHSMSELEPNAPKSNGQEIRAAKTGVFKPGVFKPGVFKPGVLKPSAAALRDRLGGQRHRAAASARPAPNGGTWNRPRTPSNLKAVQAAMARRDANDSTSR